MKAPWYAAAILTTALAAPSFAQPVVNGTIAGDAYGPAAAVQAVETGFGDNANELDAAYCAFGGGRFFLALTGNLESNFNKLEIFIDSKPGGENVLSGTPGNDGAFRMAGMAFDGGFQADYHIIVRRGFSGAPRFDLDFAQLGTPAFSSYGDVFGGSLDGAAATGTGLNTQPILVAFNNSNAAGVLGGNGPADQMAAAAVQTGLELGIAMVDLNYGGGPIKVCAFVNGSNHDYASNQFLGTLMPPQGNLGSDGTGAFTGVLSFHLGSFPGDQFCTCRDQPVPVQPTTWSRLKANYR